MTTALPKITIPSPRMAHFRVDLSRSPYPTHEEFRADVAAVYAAEVAGLYALGCRYLQFDDTIFAFLERPAVAGQRQGHRARPRPPARDQRHRHQRGAARQARRHGGHHPHVPRQLPLGLVLLRRLRLRGRGRLRRAQGRRAVPRVRRRAVRDVRAAPLRAGRPGRRARPGHHQDAGARVQGRAQAAGRGGRQVRGHRPAVPVRAVRVRLHRGGQLAHDRRGEGQARPDRRDRQEIWG